MIQRINLIEHEPFQLTYEQLLKAFVLVTLFCGLIYGVQTAIRQYYSRHEAKLNAEISSLKAQKEQLLKTTTTQIGEGPVLEIKKKFDAIPHWPTFFGDLFSRIPIHVSLTSLQIKAGEKGSIVIHGRSRTSTDVAQFLSKLGESPFFKDVVLSTSTRGETAEGGDASAKESETGFTFSVESTIIIPKG